MGPLSQPALNEILSDILQDEELMQQAWLIDIRSPDEFEKSHLPAAINVPADDDDFEARMRQAAPQKDLQIILYSDEYSAETPEQTARRMRDLGYQCMYVHTTGKLKHESVEVTGQRHPTNVPLADRQVGC